MFHHFVQVNVGPCSLLSRNSEMNFWANIEQKDQRLFSDIVLGQKQTIRHIWNNRFSCKSRSLRFKPTFLVQCCLRHIWTTLTKQYSYTMLFVPAWLTQHCIGYLHHKRCTLAIGQHSTRDFLRQCWPRQKYPPKFTEKYLYQSLFFNKVAGRESDTGVLLWILWNF